MLNIGRQWVRYWRTLSNALIEFHPEIPVKIVRYEDLCATTATVVSSIMDFAGIPPKVPGTGLSDVPSAACGANFGENIRILSPDMMASLVNETKAAVEWFDYADTIRDLLTRHENLRVSGLLQVLPEEHRKTTRGINRLSKPQGPRLRRPNRADNA